MIQFVAQIKCLTVVDNVLSLAGAFLVAVSSERFALLSCYCFDFWLLCIEGKEELFAVLLGKLVMWLQY